MTVSQLIYALNKIAATNEEAPVRPQYSDNEISIVQLVHEVDEFGAQTSYVLLESGR